MRTSFFLRTSSACLVATLLAGALMPLATAQLDFPYPTGVVVSGSKEGLGIVAPPGTRCDVTHWDQESFEVECWNTIAVNEGLNPVCANPRVDVAATGAGYAWGNVRCGGISAGCIARVIGWGACGATAFGTAPLPLVCSGGGWGAVQWHVTCTNDP